MLPTLTIFKLVALIALLFASFQFIEDSATAQNNGELQRHVFVLHNNRVYRAHTRSKYQKFGNHEIQVIKQRPTLTIVPPFATTLQTPARGRKIVSSLSSSTLWQSLSGLLKSKRPVARSRFPKQIHVLYS